MDDPHQGTATTGDLTPDEIRRYSRHLILPEVGREGQERLWHTRDRRNRAKWL